MRKINQNLSDTTEILHRSLIKLSNRGFTLDRLETDSENLLQSSNAFINYFDPWYKRILKSVFCCPSWWFRRQQKDPEEDKLHILPWVEVEELP